MSFDTALLNLVGAGLGVVGCHLCKVSDRSIRQSNPAELVEFLSREGCGRQLALLAQEVVRPLVGFYRADPDRVVRHLQQTAALLPDRAFAGEAPLLAAWNRILGERNEGAAATHDIGTACEQLADAILQQPRRVGLLTRSDLDDSLVHTILKAVLRPLAEDGAHFVALRPAFEKFVAQRARQRAKAAVMAGPAVGASADRTVQARLETARKDIERTAARAGVPVPMLSAVAADLVTAGAREDDLALWLDRKVAEFRDLDARLSRPADFDAAVATLRAQAAAALASGRLDLADLLLTQAEDVDIAASRERVEIATRHVQQASETRMLRGALAELRGHYRLSATHCAAAAGHLPVDDARGRWWLILRQARMLARLADDLGETQALEEAVGLHQLCLQLRPRQGASKDWAMTQHVFGVLHYRLSEHRDDPACLHQAIDACRAAADELTGQREPMLWAQATADYAVALHRLGERTSDRAALTDALAAQRETLAVFTRAASPQDWAQAQIGLASTLLHLARLDGSHHRLMESIAAYRTALDVLDAAAAPDQDAKARIRLAEALCIGARRDGQPRQVTEADEVLMGLRSVTGDDRVKRDRTPREWARMQAARGTVALELGRRSRSAERLQRAIECLRNALTILSPQAMPQQFATVQRDAGAAYEALSQIERFAEPRLTQSVEAYREAIGALDRGVHPQLWAHIGLDFARALHALGMESGIDRWLSEAQIVQQAALEALRTLGETALVKFAEDDLAERDQQVERSRRAGATGRR